MSHTMLNVGPLTAEQVSSVLTAAIAAPSLHNSQPWRFAVDPRGITLLADTSRGLPVADPDHREQWLACGAALLNLRMAIRAMDVATTVTLLPDPLEPAVLARVVPKGHHRASPMDRMLAGAIFRRHTFRRPMTVADVPPGLMEDLRQAARAESCWLAPLSTAQTYELGKLIVTAHRTQQSDPAYQAEFTRWTGRPPGEVDGVPATSGGTLPEAYDRLLVRDFSGGSAEARVPGKDFEPDPAIVVVGSFHDLPLAWIQAGQAMQRVLLMATAGGLSTSFISQVIEVPTARAELRMLIGAALWPQVVLRLGNGLPAVPTPRRPLDEVIDHVE